MVRAKVPVPAPGQIDPYSFQVDDADLIDRLRAWAVARGRPRQEALVVARLAAVRRVSGHNGRPLYVIEMNGELARCDEGDMP